MRIRITAIVDVGEDFDDKDEYPTRADALDGVADAAGDVLDQIGSVVDVRATRPRPARDGGGTTLTPAASR